MTRSELELKMVATLKNLLVMPRKKMGLSLKALEARYSREMGKMGWQNGNEIYRAWHDCLDVAQLELDAA